MSNDIISLDQYRQQRAEQAQDEPRRHWYAEATGKDSSRLEIRQGDKMLERWHFDAENLRLLISLLQGVQRDMRQWHTKPCPVCSKRPCYTWHQGQIVQQHGRGPAYRHEGRTRGGRHRLRNMQDASLKYMQGGRDPSWHIIGWELLVTPPAD